MLSADGGCMVTGKKEPTVSGSRGKLSKDHISLYSAMVSSGSAPSTNNDTTKPLPDLETHTSNQHKVADSMELIESEYVLVDYHYASIESLKSFLERSLINSSRFPLGAVRHSVADSMELIESEYVLVDSHCASMESLTSSLKDIATSSVDGTGKTLSSSTSAVLTNRHRLGAVRHSTRLQLLYQCAQAVSNLAKEKLDAGSLLEYISVEFTTLTIWEEILQVASSWLASSSQSSEDTVKLQVAGSSSNTEEALDFSNPSTSIVSANKGFRVACDRAVKFCKLLEAIIDGTALVPDTIKLIYEAALAYGIAGAEDALLEKRDGAARLFSNAMLLLWFIVWEAPLLPLMPPFSPHPKDKKRLLHYVRCFEFHINQLRAMQRCPSEQPSSSSTK